MLPICVTSLLPTEKTDVLTKIVSSAVHEFKYVSADPKSHPEGIHLALQYHYASVQICTLIHNLFGLQTAPGKKKKKQTMKVYYICMTRHSYHSVIKTVPVEVCVCVLQCLWKLILLFGRQSTFT